MTWNSKIYLQNLLYGDADELSVQFSLALRRGRRVSQLLSLLNTLSGCVIIKEMKKLFKWTKCPYGFVSLPVVIQKEEKVRIIPISALLYGWSCWAALLLVLVISFQRGLKGGGGGCSFPDHLHPCLSPFPWGSEKIQIPVRGCHLCMSHSWMFSGAA